MRLFKDDFHKVIYKIVSQIRTELSDQLDVKQLQKVLYNYWSDYIETPSHIVMDATCYKSVLRYPILNPKVNKANITKKRNKRVKLFKKKGQHV